MILADTITTDTGWFLRVWSDKTGETLASAVIEGDAAPVLAVTYDPARVSDREWKRFVRECHNAAGDLGAGIRFVEGQPCEC